MMKELDQIFDDFEAGVYTELETYARIAQITTQENIEQIIDDMPGRYTERFAQWIRACPYKHEVEGYIGMPLESFTDDLVAHYKRHYAALG
jgi:hypothetical protein